MTCWSVAGCGRELQGELGACAVGGAAEQVRSGWRAGGGAGRGRRWRASWADAVLAQQAQGGVRSSGGAGAS
jgi:hypothetical protein